MPLSGEYEPSPTQWVREQVEEYERSGGTSGTTLRGMPVILLTTVGARSGKLRKVPLMRVEHDGTYAAVASLGGSPHTPSGTTTCWPTRRSSCRTAPTSRT
jgi:F420H(2)-dependent quinone reductase